MKKPLIKRKTMLTYEEILKTAGVTEEDRAAVKKVLEKSEADQTTKRKRDSTHPRIPKVGARVRILSDKCGDLPKYLIGKLGRVTAFVGWEYNATGDRMLGVLRVKLDDRKAQIEVYEDEITQDVWVRRRV